MSHTTTDGHGRIDESSRMNRSTRVEQQIFLYPEIVFLKKKKN